MTNRTLLDVDFSALPDASTWPGGEFRMVTAAYGATATVTSGWGRFDSGNNGNWGGGITLQMRVPAVDRFEIFYRAKVVTASSSCWLGFQCRTTNDWNFTTGVNVGDTAGDNRQRMSFFQDVDAYKFTRRASYSTTDLVSAAAVWTTGTIVNGRVQVIGDTYQGRVWNETGAEPTTWGVRVIDASLPRKGYLSVTSGAFNAHGQVDVGRIVIREIGDPYAPVLANNGKATLNGTGAQTAFTMAHGLDGTPSNVVVTPGSSAASAAHYVTADASNVTVTYTAAPASGTGNVILHWRAEV